MKKTAIVLFVLGVIWGGILLWLKPYTGYMDADYYYSLGRNLFLGRGFVDFQLWNYLSDPGGLPAPAAAYWMPAAAIFSWLGMLIAGSDSLLAARLPFVLLFALSSVAVAGVSFAIFKNRIYALTSGCLVLLSGYYLKFVTEPDGFALLFLCGAIIAYLIHQRSSLQPILLAVGLGIISGVIQMTRADGLIWFALCGLFLLFHLAALRRVGSDNSVMPLVRGLLVFAAGHLLVSGGWYLRNLHVYGSLFPPGGVGGLWLTRYEDLFLYPPQQLNLAHWMSVGWAGIIFDRLKSLGLNLLSLVAVGGLLFLAPGIYAGVRHFPDRVQRIYWLTGLGAVLVMMSLVFPYAGSRGGFLHSLAIIQPFLWIVAPSGLSHLVQGRQTRQPRPGYSQVQVCAGMIVIVTAASFFLVWNETRQPAAITQANLWQEYRTVDQYLQKMGAPDGAGVMVANPPAYYAATMRPAVMLPTGDPREIYPIGRLFEVQYVILDANPAQAYQSLWNGLQEGSLPAQPLGQAAGMQIFQFDAEEMP